MEIKRVSDAIGEALWLRGIGVGYKDMQITAEEAEEAAQYNRSGYRVQFFYPTNGEPSYYRVVR